MYIITSLETPKVYIYKNVKSAKQALQEHRFNLKLHGVLCIGNIIEFDDIYKLNQKDGTVWECKKEQ